MSMSLSLFVMKMELHESPANSKTNVLIVCSLRLGLEVQQ